LRLLITERMEEQQECLTIRQQQVAHFLQMSYDTVDNSNRKKGPGDEQISAEMSQAVTGNGTGVIWQFGMPWTRTNFREAIADDTMRWKGGGRGAPARDPIVQPPKKKISKRKDPMGRYAQLEEEIQALMQLSPAIADPLPNSMKTPQALVGTLHKNVLTKILGTGQLLDDEESDDEGQIGLPQMQQQATIAPAPQTTLALPPTPQGIQPQMPVNMNLQPMGPPMGMPPMGMMGGPPGPPMNGFIPVAPDPADG